MAHHPDASKQMRWLDLVHRWQRCQLTVREFCQRHHVSEASFFSWRRVLRQRGLLDEPVTAKSDSLAFVKLTLPPKPPRVRVVEVVLGKRVLRVRPGFDAAMLLELVRLLEEPAC
jgi:transposase-like protein